MIPLLTLLACDTEPAIAPLHPDSLDTDGGGWTLVLSMDPDPQVVGETVLSIGLLSGETGDYDTDAVITAVTPWMPDHGHGISEAPEITDSGNGTFTAAWAWSMTGYWEVTITVDDREEAIAGYEVE